MTAEEKQIISLLCLACSAAPGQEVVIHCNNANTRAEDFKYCARVLNNCRGTNHADFDNYSISFSSGSSIWFEIFDTCDGCHGCDEINEKEKEVQDAFEEALRNMGKGEK